MRDLYFTLLSEGSSDQILLPILGWLLRRHGVNRALQPSWADLRGLRQPPGTLEEKIALSLDLYPCELLFIHRDADRVPHRERKFEILNALSRLGTASLPAICVVPVRMQEAWLLFDEPSLRRAAGNPNGEDLLLMPRLKDVELLPDPKRTLYDLLREASGLKGRRRKKFQVEVGARRIVDFIEDFTPLLRLAAFESLDRDVKSVVELNRWSDLP